jgi:hypothetical protein
MRRRAWIVTSFVLLLGAAGCTGSSHSSAESAATDPVEVATTPAPTTTTTAPTTTVPTEAPTTTPPTTATPRSTTTTLDAATKNFYEAFGGPRVDPATVKPGPKATVGELRCFAVFGSSGFGAHAVVRWSDGVVETLDSPGTYTVTTKAVATGSRGTRLDVDVFGGSACAPGVRFAGQP